MVSIASQGTHYTEQFRTNYMIDGNRQIALDSGLISVSMDLISNRDARQLAVNTLCNLCINFGESLLGHN